MRFARVCVESWLCARVREWACVGSRMDGLAVSK